MENLGLVPSPTCRDIPFYIDLHIPLGVACAIPYILAVLIASLLHPAWAMPVIDLAFSILTIAGIFIRPTSGRPNLKSFTNRGLAHFGSGLLLSR